MAEITATQKEEKNNPQEDSEPENLQKSTQLPSNEFETIHKGTFYRVVIPENTNPSEVSLKEVIVKKRKTPFADWEEHRTFIYRSMIQSKFILVDNPIELRKEAENQGSGDLIKIPFK